MAGPFLVRRAASPSPALRTRTLTATHDTPAKSMIYSLPKIVRKLGPRVDQVLRQRSSATTVDFDDKVVPLIGNHRLGHQSSATTTYSSGRLHMQPCAPSRCSRPHMQPCGCTYRLSSLYMNISPRHLYIHSPFEFAVQSWHAGVELPQG
ncbi:hypothetical protein IWZ03DRAFT_145896 [Phyllosticta citriasiana]|uniref:Uncharacterized protein n=1 Tax=Phyllosticta citriasiana TaxID=595635 RepID=A0ABR1KT91_9PEZI